MEKLRQRHRAEKQRASAFSGERFFSSWFYFEATEGMENGYNTEPDSNPQIHSEIQNPKGLNLNPGRGIRFKPSGVQNLVSLATSSTKHNMKPNPNLGPRVSNRYSSYPNNRSHLDDNEDECLIEAPICSSIGGKIRNRSLITPQPESIRPGLRPRKFSKVVHDDDDNNNSGMWIKVPSDIRRYENMNGKESNNGMKKKKEKEKDGGLSEVVTSIRLLGDGFLKMEKMKIDMAREMEKMRIESEMKRNELILESQKQIVDVFVKGVIEARKEAATNNNGAFGGL